MINYIIFFFASGSLNNISGEYIFIRLRDNQAFSLGCPVASECKNVTVFCAHTFSIPCLIQYIGQPLVGTKLCPPTMDMQCKLSSLVHQQWTLTWESAHSLSIAYL